MAIPTSRTKTKAEISIDTELCSGCGLCVEVCSDNSLELFSGKVRENPDPFFGCIACGHCMAICPEDAIEIYGREISPADLYELPARYSASSYTQLQALMQRRRSIRHFKDKAVEKEFRDQIINAAMTAPMGLPPSDVNVLVLDGKEKVRAFAVDYCNYLEKMKWLVSDWFLAIMKPFWGKANDEMFRDFLKPLFQIYTSQMKEGKNMVNYDAPLSLYFYGSPYTDPADPIIAATYAMLAAESLGLGTCMLGGIHPMIQSGKRARKFRKEHGIRFASREGLFIIIGYPSVKYRKGIRRNFASVSNIN